LRSLLYVPLMVEKRAVGTLILGTVDRPWSFSDVEIDLCRTLSTQVALAVENARLFQSSLRHALELEERVSQRTHELTAAKERAESADRLKSAFLATMSHELRTPLNSVIGFTGILLQEIPGELNDEQRKQLGMVRGSARHLLALINDVLDISKIEAGQLELLEEPFEMTEVLESVARLVSPQVEAKDLEFAVEVAPAVGRITSDRRRVEQVLLNLLSNAIKFTEQGQVRVGCALKDDSVEVVVSDTGIGMSADQLPHIFEPFRQLDTGLARRYEGTGLGLSICKRLVGLMGGDIRVASEPGVGSTFTFTLPVARREGGER